MKRKLSFSYLNELVKLLSNVSLEIFDILRHSWDI